jgi:hypothetical protein
MDQRVYKRFEKIQSAKILKTNKYRQSLQLYLLRLSQLSKWEKFNLELDINLRLILLILL